MSPGNWVAIILGLVALCWIVAYFGEIADGTPEERREYEEKRAQADKEELLRKANKEVTERPRVRAGTEPIIYKGFPHGH